MKCSATNPSLAKSAAVLEPQRGDLTKPSRARSDAVFEPQRGDLTKPSRAKSTVVFEPQRGDLTHPAMRDNGLGQRNPHQPRAPTGRSNKAQANGLGQRNPHQPRALKGRPTQSHKPAFTTEARRHRGKPADAPRHRLPGRTDGRTGSPLGSGGAGAFAPGVVTGFRRRRRREL